MISPILFSILSLIFFSSVLGDLKKIANQLSVDATDSQIRDAIDALQAEVDKLNKMIGEQKKSIKKIEKRNEEMKKQNAINESAAKKQKKLKKRKPLRNTRKTPPKKKKKSESAELEIEDMKKQLDKNTLVIEDYSKYLSTMRKEIAKASAKIKELRAREAAERYSKGNVEEMKIEEEGNEERKKVEQKDKKRKREGRETKEKSPEEKQDKDARKNEPGKQTKEEAKQDNVKRKEEEREKKKRKEEEEEIEKMEQVEEGAEDEELLLDGTTLNETNALQHIHTAYLGKVHASDWDELEQKENVTLLHECILWCGGIRNNKGNQWNALEYRNDKVCFCNQNGRGWAPSDDVVSYLFI